MEKNNLKFSALYGGGLEQIDSTENTKQQLVNYVKILLQFRTDIKMYHWQTKLFAYHKISDELLESIDDLSDKFIEAICGAFNIRPELTTNLSIELNNLSNKNIFIQKINQVKLELSGSNLILSKSEISNIRDELLETMDKAVYLLSFQ